MAEDTPESPPVKQLLLLPPIKRAPENNSFLEHAGNDLLLEALKLLLSPTLRAYFAEKRAAPNLEATKTYAAQHCGNV
ncbi:unnamed protein product, partial [Pylaiella littoralis]